MHATTSFSQQFAQFLRRCHRERSVASQTQAFLRLSLFLTVLCTPLLVSAARIDALYSDTVTALEVADVCAMIRESLEPQAELNAPILAFVSRCERILETDRAVELAPLCAHLAAAYTVVRASTAVPYDKAAHQEMVVLWQDRIDALHEYVENAFEIERLVAARKALIKREGSAPAEVRPVLQKVRAEITRRRAKQNNLVAAIKSMNAKLCVDHRSFYKKGALYRIIGYSVGGLCVTLLGVYLLRKVHQLLLASIEAHPWKWGIGLLVSSGGIVYYISQKSYPESTKSRDTEQRGDADSSAQHTVETRSGPVPGENSQGVV